MTLVYVAAPYSSIKNKHRLMEEIHKESAKFMLDRPGHYTVPGLLHHYTAEHCPHLGKDFEFWEEFCVELIKRCDIILLLKFDGWQTSKGVLGEIDTAVEFDKSVIYVEPDCKNIDSVV